MTVKQVDREVNSVTINISGMTEGDRRTSVWMPDNGEWFTLQEAKANGYISDFYVADLNDNNGDITVVMPYDYYKEYKVVDIKVENVNTQSGDSWVMLNAVLKFEYENSQTKSPGNDIDITVADMKAINLFGRYINYWLNVGDGLYYSLEGVDVGDAIFADYLSRPAQNILDAAYDNSGFLGTYYSAINRKTSNIVDNCVSGADFKASFFNNIADAINSFNLSYSI